MIDAIRCESTREEMAEVFSSYKYKARTEVGRKEKSLLCDPGSELRLLTISKKEGKKKGEENKWEGMTEGDNAGVDTARTQRLRVPYI